MQSALRAARAVDVASRNGVTLNFDQKNQLTSIPGTTRISTTRRAGA
jgi:hypothetical protein